MREPRSDVSPPSTGEAGDATNLETGGTHADRDADELAGGDQGTVRGGPQGRELGGEPAARREAPGRLLRQGRPPRHRPLGFGAGLQRLRRDAPHAGGRQGRGQGPAQGRDQRDARHLRPQPVARPALVGAVAFDPAEHSNRPNRPASPTKSHKAWPNLKFSSAFVDRFEWRRPPVTTAPSNTPPTPTASP